MNQGSIFRTPADLCSTQGSIKVSSGILASGKQSILVRVSKLLATDFIKFQIQRFPSLKVAVQGQLRHLRGLQLPLTCIRFTIGTRNFGSGAEPLDRVSTLDTQGAEEAVLAG